MCDAVHDAGGLLAAQLLHSGSTLRPVMVAEKEGPYGPSAETRRSSLRSARASADDSRRSPAS